MTLDGWQERLTRTIAREIRRHRDRRRLSAQQLADRTAELGMPIPRSVLANLESGRRGTVTVAEILVLAAALGVAPVELICPVGFDEQTELLPGRMVAPLAAAKWVGGDTDLDVSGPETVVFRRQVEFYEDMSNLDLVREYESMLEDLQTAGASSTDLGARFKDRLDQALLPVRAEMRDRGMLLTPPLPPSLWVAAGETAAQPGDADGEG